MQVLAAGDISVDSRSRVATRKQMPLPLKPKEFELLRFFIKNKGQAFTRDQLLSQILGAGILR